MDWFLYDNGLRHERVKITISKMRYLCSWLPCHRLLTSVFVLVNSIKFNRSNGLMIKCLITCLMN